MTGTRLFSLATMAALAGASTAHAQARPFDRDPPTAVELLGACPVELLRDAWSALGPLEASAVEAEVINLCTERSQAIRGLVTSYAQLEAAIGDALGPHADPVDAAMASDTPLYSGDAANAQGARAPGLSPAPVAHTAAEADEVASLEAARVDAADTRWHVLFVTRSGDDAWRAALQRSERVTTGQGAGADVGDTANALERAFEWVRQSGPPLIVREADQLPNGVVITRIDADVVQIAPLGGGPGADLPWVDGGDPTTPGDATWNWTLSDVSAEDAP